MAVVVVVVGAVVEKVEGGGYVVGLVPGGRVPGCRPSRGRRRQRRRCASVAPMAGCRSGTPQKEAPQLCRRLSSHGRPRASPRRCTIPTGPGQTMLTMMSTEDEGGDGDGRRSPGAHWVGVRNSGCISSGRKGGETARRCLAGAVGQVSLGDTTK